MIPIKIWNGTEVAVEISRLPPKEGEKHKWSDTCKKLKYSRVVGGNCVAGRRNAVVSPIIPAVATTGTAVVAAIGKNTATKVLGATALFTLASQKEIGDLFNGTDAQLTKDEIFDVYVKPTKIPAPITAQGGDKTPK